MNFTREPIIETIITPKDGYKLVVRNSKGGSQEEYHVDAVEVVSFGHSFFFRSLERPKSFLVPVTDYEVIELKETRVVLKNVSIERSIKIGGGKAPQPQHAQSIKEPTEEVVAHATEEAATSPIEAPAVAQTTKAERKRERRRNRRGRRQISQEERQPQETISKEMAPSTTEPPAQGGGPSDETQVSSSMFSSLFPPPPTLISETISRYKEKGPEAVEKDVLPQPVEEKKRRRREKQPEEESNEEASVPDEDDDYFMI